MRAKWVLLLAAIAIGVADALVFKGFEFAVNNGTDFIWNTVFKTDVHRWVVVPLAIILGVCLSAVIKLTKQKRLVTPKISPLDEEKAKDQISLTDIGIITAVGLTSLLAGASLGPEASLVGITSGLGLWVASKVNNKSASLLSLASVGGLLVAFFGSILPMIIPLLLLQKKKLLSTATAAPVVLASLGAFGTMWLINHDVVGYGTIPISKDSSINDLLTAAILGVLTAGLGYLLKRLIMAFARTAKKLNDSVHWLSAAAVFGSVIGVIYLLGGQTVEFTGSAGTHLLTANAASYSFWALIGLVVAKLLVTAWSLASGYRGGLVFPSVYIGIALALAIHSVFTSTGAGIEIGSVAGVFSAITGSPVVALIFVLSMIPLKLSAIAIAGILGAALGNRLLARLAPSAK